MEATLAPHLSFNGNAAEAMKFYHSVFGGKLTTQTYGDAKMGATPKERGLILHAVLRSGAITFMGSDTSPRRKRTFGDNIHLGITGKDSKELTEVFDRLAEGGRVDMPLGKQFWGDTFGQLTDKFGIHWMVNIVSPRPQAQP